MATLSLTDLPPDVLQRILIQASEYSVTDIMGARDSCRMLAHIFETLPPQIIGSPKFDAYDNHKLVVAFMKRYGKRVQSLNLSPVMSLRDEDFGSCLRSTSGGILHYMSIAHFRCSGWGIMAEYSKDSSWAMAQSALHSWPRGLSGLRILNLSDAHIRPTALRTLLRANRSTLEILLLAGTHVYKPQTMLEEHRVKGQATRERNSKKRLLEGGTPSGRRKGNRASEDGSDGMDEARRSRGGQEMMVGLPGVQADDGSGLQPGQLLTADGMQAYAHQHAGMAHPGTQTLVHPVSVEALPGSQTVEAIQPVDAGVPVPWASAPMPGAPQPQVTAWGHAAAAGVAVPRGSTEWATSPAPASASSRYSGPQELNEDEDCITSAMRSLAFPRLRTLDLSGCRVTKQGLVDVLRSNLNLTILYIHGLQEFAHDPEHGTTTVRAWNNQELQALRTQFPTLNIVGGSLFGGLQGMASVLFESNEVFGRHAPCVAHNSPGEAMPPETPEGTYVHLPPELVEPAIPRGLHAGRARDGLGMTLVQEAVFVLSCGLADPGDSVQFLQRLVDESGADATGPVLRVSPRRAAEDRNWDPYATQYPSETQRWALPVGRWRCTEHFNAFLPMPGCNAMHIAAQNDAPLAIFQWLYQNGVSPAEPDSIGNSIPLSEGVLFRLNRPALDFLIEVTPPAALAEWVERRHAVPGAWRRTTTLHEVSRAAGEIAPALAFETGATAAREMLESAAVMNARSVVARRNPVDTSALLALAARWPAGLVTPDIHFVKHQTNVVTSTLSEYPLELAVQRPSISLAVVEALLRLASPYLNDPAACGRQAREAHLKTRHTDNAAVLRRPGGQAPRPVPPQPQHTVQRGSVPPPEPSDAEAHARLLDRLLNAAARRARVSPRKSSVPVPGSGLSRVAWVFGDRPGDGADPEAWAVLSAVRVAAESACNASMAAVAPAYPGLPSPYGLQAAGLWPDAAGVALGQPIAAGSPAPGDPMAIASLSAELLVTDRWAPEATIDVQAAVPAANRLSAAAAAAAAGRPRRDGRTSK
eukprot:tig00000404_g375.t1